jgi:hypothetical protein
MWFLFKSVISVRGGRCDYAPRGPKKNVVTQLVNTRVLVPPQWICLFLQHPVCRHCELHPAIGAAERLRPGNDLERPLRKIRPDRTGAWHHLDNMKLLLICILRVLLSHFFIFFRLYFYHYIYRVSQEESARLRENVSYVKVQRYKPKTPIFNLERLRS